jgi:hypothetical protein
MINKEIEVPSPERLGFEVICLDKKDTPLINSYLNTLRYSNLVINKEDFSFLLEATAPMTKPYLMSMANRKAGDLSGILGHLAGVGRDSRHTERIINRIGQNALNSIALSGKKDVIIRLLNGESSVPLDNTTFNLIDNLAFKVIKDIKEAAYNCYLVDNPGEQTAKATVFRKENEKKMDELIQYFGGDVSKLLNYQYQTDYQGNITTVSEQLIVPKIDATSILQILPKALNGNFNTEAPSANDPLGFVARINMAGGPLHRIIANYIRQREQIARYIDKHQ